MWTPEGLNIPLKKATHIRPTGENFLFSSIFLLFLVFCGFNLFFGGSVDFDILGLNFPFLLVQLFPQVIRFQFGFSIQSSRFNAVLEGNDTAQLDNNMIGEIKYYYLAIDYQYHFFFFQLCPLLSTINFASLKTNMMA